MEADPGEEAAHRVPLRRPVLEQQPAAVGEVPDGRWREAPDGVEAVRARHQRGTRLPREIAADVFELRGRDRSDVTPVSTAEYGEGKSMAPRPEQSALALGKIEATGFVARPAADRLREYVAGL